MLPRAIGPFLVINKFRRLNGNDRYLFTVSRSDGVDLCVLVCFNEIGVGISGLHLLNVYFRFAHRAIVGTRTCNSGSVAFVNVSVKPRIAIRAGRSFIRQVIHEWYKGSRWDTSNERSNFLGRDAGLLLNFSRLRTLSGRRREPFHAVCWFDDLPCNLQLRFKGKGVTASVIRLDEHVFYFLRLNIFDGVRRSQSQASTLYRVRDAYRYPNRVFYAAGLMAPFHSELDGTCRIRFLGYVHARRIHPCLTNGSGSEHAIGRNVYGTHSDVNDAQSANGRAGTGLT